MLAPNERRRLVPGFTEARPGDCVPVEQHETPRDRLALPAMDARGYFVPQQYERRWIWYDGRVVAVWWRSQ